MSADHSSEQPVWEGGPSQAMNFGTHLLGVLFCWLIVPAAVAAWRYLVTRSRRYELTTERLRVSEGVFSRQTDELELYRVKDGRLVQPFALRLFGVGNIELSTSDKSHPTVLLEAVAEPAALWEKIRGQVEELRARKGIRDIDVS